MTFFLNDPGEPLLGELATDTKHAPVVADVPELNLELGSGAVRGHPLSLEQVQPAMSVGLRHVARV